MNSDLKIQVDTLPNLPGVYQYYNKSDVIIYVGKAKDLKKRVRSYFTKTHDNHKTSVLVSKIHYLEHIVVETETDALLLENNLIKKYKPRYNVLLKDDKTYPWICIKNENFPRIFITRRVVKDGSEYFGPYTSIKSVRALLGLIKELFKVRTCNFDLSNKNIEQGKFKICLEYHIKNCLGPCEGFQSSQDYNKDIQAIRQLIKGDFKKSIDLFTRMMFEFSSEHKFEQAQEIKNKLDLLTNHKSKSTVVSPTITNVDVFSIVSDQTYAFVNYLRVQNGAIIQSFTAEIKKKLNEEDSELLKLAIVDIRLRFHSETKHVLTQFELSLGEKITVSVPKLGDKKRVLDLSLRNAKYYRHDRYKQIQIVDPERHEKRVLGQLQKDLKLSQYPIHIECFDNSNIQGTHPVAACVVFKKAKPSKSDYRHYNIKTVVGPDDFASMEEVVFRRYRRLLDEKQSLPQLIVIDGGKGQLSAALKSLDLLGLRGKIAIIGIAKRLEEIYFPEDSVPLYLNKKSESLKLIQFLRNEAHRFGITFHKNKRSTSALKSELDQIKGIGKETISLLFVKFKSIKAISNASIDDLQKCIGQNRAKIIYKYYNEN